MQSSVYVTVQCQCICLSVRLSVSIHLLLQVAAVGLAGRRYRSIAPWSMLSSSGVQQANVSSAMSPPYVGSLTQSCSTSLHVALQV